ncbi:hypothetical protein GO308_12785 [Sphingomonas sp. SFZ2018-12]|uniref:hypothetical protein n=1 Tax=Sphingomonas sp. SFZ2018-12 TaxID=2683197 RepID=UPI001F0E1029|nr:hypothetical protein [Sphingomonas sp. SFZ2018-12]MCH4893991.1 hypothetical protein [Sphingomonas sp. SFZ2018-12]
MNLSQVIRDMAAAGAPTEAIAIAVEAIEAAHALAGQAAGEIEQRRKAERERKQRQRARDSHGTVTGQSRDTAGTVPPEPAPSSPPLLSPQTPQTTPPLHPHPEGNIAPAREAREAVPAKSRRSGRAAGLDYPPPDGVTAEQWAALLAIRRAKRSPLTDHAHSLLCARLAKLSSDEWPPGRLADLMIERNWISIEAAWLPSASNPDGKRHYHDRPSGPLESRRRFREQHGLDDRYGYADV